jgi:hypothetical protein
MPGRMLTGHLRNAHTAVMTQLSSCKFKSDLPMNLPRISIDVVDVQSNGMTDDFVLSIIGFDTTGSVPIINCEPNQYYV